MCADPRPIKPLSDQLINRIAAGEVIERPASVLKELLENSLDAQARNIEINVAGGGIDLIEVSDDGYGVRGPEMMLALARHCTSKIDDEHDLLRIDSLGFRGEALASIAAVADVTLCSRTVDDAHGWCIRSTPGGVPAPPEPHAHPGGTKVEVCGLFHNTPARRRFLKRPQTEYHHIHQLVRRLGFCRPEVSFVLNDDGRPRLRLPMAGDARSSERRWRQLFGAGFAADALSLDIRAGDVRISGWVGDAALARSQTDLQFLAVNGRTIRDTQLARAVRLAFEDRLHPGKYPTYALHIVLPADAVDVNVHPGKMEVRFADVRQVHDLLYTAIRRTLDGESPGETQAAYQMSDTSTDGGYGVHDRRALPLWPAGAAVAKGPLPKTGDRKFGRVVAVVDGRFALTLGDGGLKVVDLRGLLRAVVTGRLASAAGRGPIASRPLLVPKAMRLPSDRLSDHQSRKLASYGIDIGELGPASAVIRSLPVVFPDVDTDHFGRVLSEALSDGSDISIRMLGHLAAETANIAGSETRCSEFLDVLERSSIEADIAAEDFSVLVDGDVLEKLVGK